MTSPTDWSPLGDYEGFRAWSGRPRSWGQADAGWRVWFGGNVVEGLCEVLDEHLSAKRSVGRSAAIGCVPWLTSPEVIDRLLMLSHVCVVVDKGAALPQRLIDEPEIGFPNIALPQLSGLMRTERGETPIVGPYTPRELVEYELVVCHTNKYAVGW